MRRAVAGNPAARAFLEALKFTEPDIVAEVLEVILPRYARLAERGAQPADPGTAADGPAGVAALDRAQHAADLDCIMRAMDEADAGRRSELLEQLRQTAFLIGENAGSGSLRLMPPGALYQRTRDLEIYLDGNPDAWFAADTYGPWLVQLRAMGVRDEVDVQARAPGPLGHVLLVAGFARHERGLDGFDPEARIDGLEFALAHPGHARAEFVWNILLAPHRRLIGGVVEKSVREQFADSTRETVRSAAGQAAVSEAWLPGPDGLFHRPADLSLDDLPPTFARDEGLAQALGMSQPVVSQAARRLGIPPEVLWGLSAHPDLAAMIERELKLRAAGQQSAGTARGVTGRLRRAPQRSTSTSSTQALTAAMMMASTKATGSQYRPPPWPVTSVTPASSRLTVSPAAVIRRSTSGASSPVRLRLAASARSGEVALPRPATRMNADSAPRGIAGTSPIRLTTRTISRAASASRARPVRKFWPSRLSAASTVLMLTLRPTKIRPLSAAVAPAAARKRALQSWAMYAAVISGLPCPLTVPSPEFNVAPRPHREVTSHASHSREIPGHRRRRMHRRVGGPAAARRGRPGGGDRPEPGPAPLRPPLAGPGRAARIRPARRDQRPGRRGRGGGPRDHARGAPGRPAAAVLRRGSAARGHGQRGRHGQRVRGHPGRGRPYRAGPGEFRGGVRAAGGHAAGVVADNSPLLPDSFYGVYKAANEGTAKVYATGHGIGSVALRPFIVYGLGRDQGMTSDPTKAMLAAAAGVPFRIKFSGSMLLTYAPDCARAFIASARAAAGSGEAISLNVPGQRIGVPALAGLIEDILPGSGGLITWEDNPLPVPSLLAGPALRDAVGDVPGTALADGVRETIKGFQDALAAGIIAAPV